MPDRGVARDPFGENDSLVDRGALEEPLDADDYEGYRWLRDRSPVPIASGEEECGRQAFRPLIDGRCLDIYQVDLSRNGFTDSAYIRQRVEEIGARLCNHCYTSPVTVAASASAGLKPAAIRDARAVD